MARSGRSPGAGPRARHAGVGLALDVVVDRPRAAGGEVAAEQVQRIVERAGPHGSATNIVATQVSSSREMIRGLVSVT